MQTQNINKLKVNKIFIHSKTLIQGNLNPKYKTTLCKKYSADQGCPYGDKCQFAHGAQELRLFSGQNIPQNVLNLNKSQSFLNYKIVKCKNWEKDKTCKYGAHCTFAHGDEELRNKTDNLYQFNPSMQFMMPMIVSPVGMDMNQINQIPQFMTNGQLINIIPNQGQEQFNNQQNMEQK